MTLREAYRSQAALIHIPVCRDRPLVAVMIVIEVWGSGRIAWPWFTLIGPVTTLTVAGALRRGERDAVPEE